MDPPAAEPERAGPLTAPRLQTLAVALAIFVGAFAGYYLSTYIGDEQLARWCSAEEKKSVIHPDCWYQHYLFLTEAMTKGTLDLSEAGVPDYYQDVVRLPTGEVYLPYQPAPAVLMFPFVAVWGLDFSELHFAMAIGALNVAIFWYILRLLRVSTFNTLLLVPFFAFGTMNFYSATTGTLWFYNHVVAVLFLLLVIVCMLRRAPPALAGLFLALAFMSRQPALLAAPLFAYWIVRDQYPNVFSRDTINALLRDRRALGQVGQFIAAMVPFALISLWYNDVRFGSPFDTGLDELWHGYGGIPYTFYLADVPGAERYDAFDLRNVPLHLYTIFLLPPRFIGGLGFVQPSPFGMSLLLVSPPLIFAALIKKWDTLKKALWLTVPAVAIPTLLYYSQGWVQYGYRYMMDYIPFLMLLTAWGFEDNDSPNARRVKIALVGLAIVAGLWGRYWATKLSW